MEFWQAYLSFLAAASLITFFVYAKDKERAKHGKRRISEETLLLLSIFGGAIGGYLAMKLVRHKTKKWYFHFANLFGIVIQVAVLVYLMMNANIL